MKKQILIMLFSSTLIACASGPETAADADFPEPRRGSDCISEGTIRNYEVLDDSNIVVTAGASRKYHVELARRAYNLKSSWNIGFISPTGRICGGFSELLVDDTFGPERIRLQSVRRITDEEHEDLRYLFDKGDARPEEALPPEDIEGAEVEELD